MANTCAMSSVFGKDFFFFAGVICVLILALKLLYFIVRFVYVYFLSSLLGLSLNVHRLGHWAVVTGCTDGIGKAYVEQLAEKGCNVVLISRSAEKLATLAQDIEGKYKVETRVIVADFSNEDIYENITNDLIGLDVGILVNNVGMSYDYPEFLLELLDRDQKIHDMMNINMRSMTMMSSIVLQNMVSKRKGAIVNVSSMSGLFPMPLLSMYSASKAYVRFLSQGLHTEYEGKGITIQCLLPYFVSTKMSRMKPTFLIPTATDYVKSALGVLGVETQVAGYWSHELLISAYALLPNWIAEKYVMTTYLSIRGKALKRRAKKGE